MIPSPRSEKCHPFCPPRGAPMPTCLAKPPVAPCCWICLRPSLCLARFALTVVGACVCWPLSFPTFAPSIRPGWPIPSRTGGSSPKFGHFVLTPHMDVWRFASIQRHKEEAIPADSQNGWHSVPTLPHRYPGFDSFFSVTCQPLAAVIFAACRHVPRSVRGALLTTPLRVSCRATPRQLGIHRTRTECSAPRSGGKE